MRYIEWLCVVCIGGMRNRSCQSDWLRGGNHGFHSRTGSTYCDIHGSGRTCTKVLPLKLPIVAYCSIIGLLSASPISPVRDL